MGKKKVLSVLVGVLVILVGLAYLGNIFLDWNFTIFFDGWWSLFIIIPCLVSIITEKLNPLNALGLSVGVFFLLTNLLDISDEDTKNIAFAGIILFVGFSILYNAFRKKKDKNVGFVNLERKKDVYNNDYPEYFAFFSGSEVNNCSTDLKGAKITAIFGGFECDFSQSVVKNDIVIEVISIFGGNEIVAPKGVKIKNKPVSIFGGSSCTAPSETGDSNAPTVFFKTVSIFGGSEIK